MLTEPLARGELAGRCWQQLHVWHGSSQPQQRPSDNRMLVRERVSVPGSFHPVTLHESDTGADITEATYNPGWSHLW